MLVLVEDYGQFEEGSDVTCSGRVRVRGVEERMIVLLCSGGGGGSC